MKINLMRVGLLVSIIGVLLLSIEMLGVVDKKYTYIVVAELLVIDLLIGSIWIILMYRHLVVSRSTEITIPRFKLKEVKVKGNEDIAPKYISPTNPRNASVFRIMFETDPGTDIEFNVQKQCRGIIRNGINNQIFDTKGDITDKLRFSTNIIVHPDEAINFKFVKDVFIYILVAEEIYRP